jgi:hypothetical protein
MEPIRTEKQLAAFVRSVFGVTIPNVQVCERHSTPWRAFCDAYFGRYPVVVWKASRGFGGKSYLSALLAATEAVTLGADVCVLGGSQDQSINVQRYTTQFFGNGSVEGLLDGQPRQRITELTLGNSIRALAASQTSVRSPHVPRLRLDEVDEMDLSLFDASLGIPMSKDGVKAQTVVSSTHQYSNGTMTAVLKRAKDKQWPVHEWCYLENLQPHGWLSQADVDDKRRTVTDAMFSVEYDMQEPNPENRAIQPEQVIAAFRIDLGEFRGQPGEYIEIEGPVPGGRYVTGADWARKTDWTVILTFRIDVKPYRMVAFLRTGRLSWPVMVSRFEERCQRYPGEAAHDGTGLGDVVDGYMAVQAKSVIMVGRERSNMLSRYISMVEHGELEYPMIDYLYGEHLYASVDDVYGAGHLPDTISAGALAVSCIPVNSGSIFLFAV